MRLEKAGIKSADCTGPIRLGGIAINEPELLVLQSASSLLTCH